MSIKKLKLIGLVVAFILPFPLHFLYELFPNFLTSIFAPVNESIFEHMKLLFTSILIAGITQKLIVKAKKLDINNVCFSNFLAAISSIPIFLVMFLPYYYFVGESLIITIIIMFIAIFLAELISYKIMQMPKFKMENITILLAIITYIIFTIFTYHPLENAFFIDPLTQTYGITNKNQN